MGTKQDGGGFITIPELLGTAGFVGGLDYLSRIAHDFQAAASVEGITKSLDFGATTAVGALLFCAYRFLRNTPESPNNSAPKP